MKKQKVFVGIGCGVVQLGLWAYYAKSKNCRIVLARINQKKVDQLRGNKGFYSINIAHKENIETRSIGPVEVYGLKNVEERREIIQALKIADVIVTAVPSTNSYDEGGVAGLLREGLEGRQDGVIIYASENRIKAAKYLQELVDPDGLLKNIYFLDTVIARMGGMQDPLSLAEEGIVLTPITPADSNAILVEDFDKIILEKNKSGKDPMTTFPNFVFSDAIDRHEDLKLYGHNAVHYLLGSIAKDKKYTHMSDLAKDLEALEFGRGALLEETGCWFNASNKGVLFTETEYTEWVENILDRITNPHLYDKVDRVIKDPERKLGYNDRIIGAITKALDAGTVPRRFIYGAILAVKNALNKGSFDRECEDFLETIWREDASSAQIKKLIVLFKQIDGQTKD